MSLGRRTLGEVVLDRWRVRTASRVFGPVLPVVWALLLCGRLAGLVARRPRTSAAVGAMVGLAAACRVWPIGAPSAVLSVALAGAWWAVLAPGGFARWVGLPCLSVWRGARYRRRWAAAMHAAGLTLPGPGGVVLLPRLRRVRCLEHVDVVHVRGLLGQRFAEWEDAAGMLGHAFGASGVVVRRGDDRRLTLELRRGRRGRSWDRDPVPYGAGL